MTSSAPARGAPANRADQEVSEPTATAERTAEARELALRREQAVLLEATAAARERVINAMEKELATLRGAVEFFQAELHRHDAVHRERMRALMRARLDASPALRRLATAEAGKPSD